MLRLFTVRFGVNKQQNPHTLLHLIYPRNYTHVHTRITTSDWYDHSCVTGVRQKFEARECQEKRINTIQARCWSTLSPLPGDMIKCLFFERSWGWIKSWSRSFCSASAHLMDSPTWQTIFVEITVFPFWANFSKLILCTDWQFGPTKYLETSFNASS